VLLAVACIRNQDSFSTDEYVKNGYLHIAASIAKELRDRKGRVYVKYSLTSNGGNLFKACRSKMFSE